MQPRLSYRARVAVVPLDPRAEAILRAVPDPEDLLAVRLDAETVDAVAGTDVLLFFAADAGAVTRDPLVAVATELRVQGALVAGVVTGAVAAAEGTDAEREGLAALREAVDMLVVVRDEALISELFDVLRGGRKDLLLADG